MESNGSYNYRDRSRVDPVKAKGSGEKGKGEQDIGEETGVQEVE